MMLWVLALVAAAAPADLKAVGVVISAQSGRKVAILQSAGRSRVVAVGETAFGGRVAAIESGRVMVEFDGEQKELRLPRAQPLPPAPAPVVAAARTEPAADGVTIERRELERRLASETSRILAETTLTPVTEGTNVTGFRLSRIPEGSILSDAGLQPGDVLTSVNDVPIDSLATLVGLYPRLQTESNVRAVVLRSGVPVTLSLQLR
jgi:general secretion pathway protein C